MKLYLIRHGETNLTLQKKYCGVSDPPLNQTGRQNAVKLNHVFNKIQIDHILSSPSLRAKETTEIVFPNLKTDISDNLKEMNFGVFEGYDYNYLSNHYPEIYNNWIYNPIDVIPPESEPFVDFYKRVTMEFIKILTIGCDINIAVITHSGVIKTMLHAAKHGIKSKIEIEIALEILGQRIDPCSYSLITGGIDKQEIIETNKKSHQ